MKKVASIIFALVLALCLTLALPMSASAETADFKNGVQVSISTDKESYDLGEGIVVKVKITNTNDYDLMGVSVETLLPEGFELESGELSHSAVSILAGETKDFVAVAYHPDYPSEDDSSEGTPSDESSSDAASSAPPAKEEVSSSSSSDTSAKENDDDSPIYITLPETNVSSSVVTAPESSEPSNEDNSSKPASGDEDGGVPKKVDPASIILAVLIVIVLAGGVIVALRYRRHATRMFSFILCAAIVLSVVTFATNNSTNTLNVEKTITVGGDEYLVAATVTWEEQAPAIPEDAFTRGQWISLLAEKFEIPAVEISEDYECFYGDSVYSEYGPLAEAFYQLALLPAPDSAGYEDPEQDVPMFEARKVLTREYAAYTIAKIMGYQGEYSLNCSDVATVTYKNEVAVMVQQGYMSLVGGAFSPNDYLKAADKDVIFGKIDEVEDSVEVEDSEIKDEIILDEAVIALTDTGYIADETAAGYTVTLKATEETAAISAGTVFTLPANAKYLGGLALKAVAVQTVGENLVIECTVPEMEEVIDSFDFAGHGVVVETEIEAVEGVSIEVVPEESVETESGAASDDEAEAGSATDTESDSADAATDASEIDGASEAEVNSDTDGVTDASASDVAGETATADETEIDTVAEPEIVTLSAVHEAIPMFDLGDSVPIPGKLEFKFEGEEIGDTGVKLNGEFEVTVPDITARAKGRILGGLSLDELTFTITSELKVSGGAKYDFGVPESGFDVTTGDPTFGTGKIEIGRIPIALGASGLTVDFVAFANLEIEGKVSIGYTIENTSGFQYKDDAFRLINDYTTEFDTLELNADAKVGIGLAARITLFSVFDLAGVDAHAGLGAQASFTPHLDVNPNLYCADGNLYLYAKLELDTDTVVFGILEDAFGMTWSWDIYDEDSSPVRENLHIENLRVVEECTYVSAKGHILGAVKDAETGDAIGNARIRLFDADSGALVRTVYTQRTSFIMSGFELYKGEFLAENLPVGRYRVEVLATGYQAYSIMVDVLEGQRVVCEAALMLLREDIAGPGTVIGDVTNALTGQPVEGVSYTVMKGWNTESGEVVVQGTFAASSFELSLNPGNYTVHISKEEFINVSYNIAVLSDVEVVKNLAISPVDGVGVAEGSFRVVLTWGDMPYDLDSHLYCIDSDGNAVYHTCYYDQEIYDEYEVIIADLDVDDVDQFGPETTTVHTVVDGNKYSFYVHDYSNLESVYSTELSNSGAQVKLFSGETLVATFNVPSNREGTLWHVFDYDASTGYFEYVNEFTYSDRG